MLINIEEYEIKSRTFKEGFYQFLYSTRGIQNYWKLFLTLTLLFSVSQQIFEVIANQVSDNDFVLLISFFFNGLILPIFAIDLFKYRDNINISASLKASFYKTFDFKVYILLALSFILIFICYRIAVQPIISELKGFSLESFIGLYQVIANTEDAILLKEIIDNNAVYSGIISSLGNVSGFEFMIFFLIASFIFIVFAVLLFFVFVLLIHFPHISFMQASKISVINNKRNSGYITSVTFGFVVFMIIGLIVSQSELLNILVGNFLSVYVFYIFSVLISDTVIEKKTL